MAEKQELPKTVLMVSDRCNYGGAVDEGHHIKGRLKKVVPPGNKVAVPLSDIKPCVAAGFEFVDASSALKKALAERGLL